MWKLSERENLCEGWMRLQTQDQQWLIGMTCCFEAAGVSSLQHGREYLEISLCFMHRCWKPCTTHTTSSSARIICEPLVSWFCLVLGGSMIKHHWIVKYFCPVHDSTIKGNTVVGVVSFVMFWSLIFTLSDPKNCMYMKYSLTRRSEFSVHCHRLFLYTPSWIAVLHFDVQVDLLHSGNVSKCMNKQMQA